MLSKESYYKLQFARYCQRSHAQIGELTIEYFTDVLSADGIKVETNPRCHPCAESLLNFICNLLDEFDSQEDE